MRAMNSERPQFLFGKEAVFLVLALAAILSPLNLLGFDDTKRDGEEMIFSRQQIAAVEDSFDWADGIITALGEMAPTLVQPQAAPLEHARPRQRRYILSRRGTTLHMEKFPEGRRLFLHKSTVFGIFDVTVDEIRPGFFSLLIRSTEPAENIQIKDQVSRAVLVDRPLNDEKVFIVQVHQKLSPKIVVSVSVLQDGEINEAYFPLL